MKGHAFSRAVIDLPEVGPSRTLSTALVSSLTSYRVWDAATLNLPWPWIPVFCHADLLIRSRQAANGLPIHFGKPRFSSRNGVRRIRRSEWMVGKTTRHRSGLRTAHRKAEARASAFSGRHWFTRTGGPQLPSLAIAGCYDRAGWRTPAEPKLRLALHVTAAIQRETWSTGAPCSRPFFARNNGSLFRRRAADAQPCRESAPARWCAACHRVAW